MTGGITAAATTTTATKRSARRRKKKIRKEKTGWRFKFPRAARQLYTAPPQCARARARNKYTRLSSFFVCGARPYPSPVRFFVGAVGMARASVRTRRRRRRIQVSGRARARAPTNQPASHRARVHVFGGDDKSRRRRRQRRSLYGGGSPPSSSSLRARRTHRPPELPPLPRSVAS